MTRFKIYVPIVSAATLASILLLSRSLLGPNHGWIQARQRTPHSGDLSLQRMSKEDGLWEDQFDGLNYPQVKPYLSSASIIAISQHEDINLRSKWQRAQMKSFCHKYSLHNQLHVLPYDDDWYSLYRHLIFDDERKFLFCFLPKAGCTTLRRLVFAVQGLIPQESVNWEKVSEEQYLVPAMKKGTFLNKTLTHPQRLKRVKEYFKFVMVRNPLERLVSAYCDKIEHPITFSFSDNSSNIILSHQSLPKELDFFEAHRRWILSQYRHAELERWAKSGGSFTLQPSFSDFVRWIVNSDDSKMNEHFASTIVNAQPCKIWYHFYANFKNYSREIRLLIHKLNIPPHYFVDHTSHAPGNETSTKLHHYYSQLSPQLKRDLFEHMFQELDFYYHLYPEEQWSHTELLGVTEPVLSPDLISS